VRFENAPHALREGPQLGRFTIAAEGDQAVLSALLPPGSPLGMPDSPDARAFRAAANAHLDYLLQRAFPPSSSPPAPQIDLSDTRTQLLQRLDPAQTIPARVRASLSVAGAQPLGLTAQTPGAPGSAGPEGDPLAPIMDAPSFPQPMYEALRDLSQDHLFPGLEHVPANSITVLETNPAFVASFLVGLNAEMGRELLWRGYPTDQRGTYFRRFWEPASGAGQFPDVDPITTWGQRTPGQVVRTGEQLVLLIRGDLLRRYPSSVVYAVKAVSLGGRLDLSPAATDELHPLFRGTLTPDVTFLGFALKKDDAIADPGWFFVIQEQPTEPRFGLDVADFDQPLPALTTWNALSWRHLASTEAELNQLSHASVKTALPTIDKVTWGRNAAHQAFITLQRPVRIAIHAKDLLPR
jgi:hypothetical protein